MKYKLWEWNQDLITGNSLVDTEHQVLFRVINDLIMALNTDESDTLSIEVAIHELIKYVAFHFTDEENLMKKFNYENLEEHQNQHYNFEVKILNFGLRFKKGENISAALLNYMNVWLVEHILVTDKLAMKVCNQP
jgi:hemerythrin-like metal-binding protein